MKPSLTALIVLSLLTPLVSAQDGPPAGTDADKQLSQMQKDMNAMLRQIARLRQQSQLQKNLNKMQRQIEDLESAADPKARQKLLQAHMQTLQEQMKLVQNMSEAEGGSTGKQQTLQAVPAMPGRMIYGPGPMRFPGRMMYGPRMTGAPQGYPGGMFGPGSPMAVPPGGATTPRYR